MSETILGKVSVTPKGAYAAGTQYERLDAISHEGGSWMALKTVQGVEPGTDPESWMQLAEKGKTGDTGPQGAPGKDGVDGSPGPAGQNGQDGAAATIQVGEVVTLEPGQPAAVENTGTEQAAVLKISIPRGQNGRDGDPGQAGAAATIQVGQVTTLDAGQQATVTNAGTVSAARFDFGIPKGQDGADGAPDQDGKDGQPGADGEDGGYYTPALDAEGNLSWTASKSGMAAAAGANIKGPKGDKGDAGEPGAAGPAGASATINGVNALTLAAGENVEIEQTGSTVTISAQGGGSPLYVTVTGTDPNFSADFSCAEIYAAYQAGRPVYAVWDGMLLAPLQIEAELAWFTYSASNSYGEVMLQAEGAMQYVFAGSGSLEAKDIGFVSTSEHITATNLQDAFEQLLEALGM